MSDTKTEVCHEEEQDRTDGGVELNSLVLSQAVANAAIADHIGVSRSQMEGVYEVPNGIKVLFRGDSDGT